jgi:hypothetical protein
VSAPEKLRRAILADLEGTSGWTPTDVFHFALTHGGSRATYAALAQLVMRGKVHHEPKTEHAPERWWMA